MDRHFDEELKVLKEKLISMSAYAEEMIAKSIAALKERRHELIGEVLEVSRWKNFSWAFAATLDERFVIQSVE